MTPEGVDAAQRLLEQRSRIKTTLLRIEQSGGKWLEASVAAIANPNEIGFGHIGVIVDADVVAQACRTMLDRNYARLKALGVEP